MAKIYDFSFLGLSRNQHYDDGVLLMDENGLTDESLRSCLIYHNADKQISHEPSVYFEKGQNKRLSVFQYSQDIFEDNEIVVSNKFLIQTKHKWKSHLIGDILDTETGELLEKIKHDCTDLESAVKRKRKAIKKYSDFYEPLYQLRKVSCMFITLTQANVALSNTNIRDAINVIRKRFERHNIRVLAHLWVSEISHKGHWHYHIAITTERVQWKHIPQWAKFNDLWTRRTQIEFIRKSIASYLGKYIGKDNMGRMIGFRQYGMSRNFLMPT
jgi:hypothetical protein